MKSYKINYNDKKCELCEIGKKYKTDKCSQNYMNEHCHPYTLYYDELFKNKKDEKLIIGEIGIYKGASLRMWEEYFKNSTIYGFDSYEKYLIDFTNNYDSDRIILNILDVKNKNQIIDVFDKIDKQFDIIIDDSTQQLDDQINIIENTYKYLKPGGILIIEDIFLSYNENDYYDKLKNILNNFDDYYFCTLDHIYRKSPGWDNDKLLILIKK